MAHSKSKTHSDESTIETIVLTINFNKLAIAFQQAIARKEIIGVISPPGVGFKFALKQFVKKHYLKIVYCNVQQTSSISEIFLTLFKHLCNIKFSNIDYKRVTLFDLSLALNYRLSIGDNCLLCIDNCNLKGAQLRYFIQFLNHYNKPVGIVFRMNYKHAQILSNPNGKWGIEYQNLLKVVDNWRVIDAPSEDDIIDICKALDVKDEMIVSDIVKNSPPNLSIIKKHIDRYLKFKYEK